MFLTPRQGFELCVRQPASVIDFLELGAEFLKGPQTRGLLVLVGAPLRAHSTIFCCQSITSLAAS
jgi:hypothetical protein